ncbi:MAG: nucleoside triphosphate pyrophosphohydrolase [Myxococcota bacterium]
MSDVKRLLDIMANLRDPQDGCPWDVEQSFETIAPYTIEEAYEVDDAIRRRDFDGLRDELGDLLLQVVFHARMAEEEGRFDFGDVVEAVCDKLVRRHPHVFGDADIATAEAQTDAWEQQKAQERARRGETGVADGVPLGLPALLRAGKLLRRAGRAGIDVQSAEQSSRHAAAALAVVSGGDAAPLGPLLLAVARLAHGLGADAEEALRGSVAELERALRSRETESA